MKKTIMIIILICAVLINSGSIKAEEDIPQIDWQAEGFQKISVTAYCCGHHTANGSAVHNGGCAASAEHMGDVAILYTMDGTFLGYYECNDAGGTDAIRNGCVVDIYRQNLTQAKNFMRITGGKAYIKWIKGAG